MFVARRAELALIEGTAILAVLLLSLLSTQPTFALACDEDVLQRARAQHLARDPQWLRLLHFRRTFPFFVSQADGKGFFVSPHGYESPEKELEADIRGLCAGEARATSNKNLPQLPVRCQFPSRERFLRERLNLERAPWPEPACPDLDQWRERLKSDTMTLVFASYYPNNPSSVFGHTLLRLNRKPSPQNPVSSSLLSYGINFAATADTKNPIKYALWGLAGGFPGEFSAQRYYYKVREYSDLESRDIWEYRLDVTPDEISRFVDHVWELGFTHFNYYYFTENCSYHLLAALEGAIERLNVSERLPWWVIPIDSVRAVAGTPGLVSSVEFRPSVYRQLVQRTERMKPFPAARAYFDRLVFEHDLGAPVDLAEEPRALAIDAALDYWDLKHFRDLADEKSAASDYKQRLLVQRAKLPQTPPLATTDRETQRPDRGHGSFRYGLSLGHDDLRGSFGVVNLRFALHDFLDPLRGFPETSSIEFLNFRGRQYFDRRRTQIDEVMLFNVRRLSPVTRFEYPTSWSVKIGAETPGGFGCRACLAPVASFGSGFAADFVHHALLTYALAGARVGTRDDHAPTVVVGGQANFGFRVRMTDSWLTNVEAQWVRGLGAKLKDNLTFTAESRYAWASNWSVDLRASTTDEKDDQAILTLSHYR